MKPPYQITNKSLSLIASISEKIGEIKSARLIKPPTELRKRNRIKIIQSSLEIEGNTLTVEQITDLIDNKRVLAPKKDILEVKNAIKVYSMLNNLDVYQLARRRRCTGSTRTPRAACCSPATLPLARNIRRRSKAARSRNIISRSSPVRLTRRAPSTCR